MEYQCKGFLEKNRDTLYEELVDIMRTSEVILPVKKREGVFHSSQPICNTFLLVTTVISFHFWPTFSKKRSEALPTVEVSK